jgi:mono/diheme cytochrome c family protein
MESNLHMIVRTEIPNTYSLRKSVRFPVIRRLIPLLSLLVVTFVLSACSDDRAAPAKVTVATSASNEPKPAAKIVRWYKPDQVQRGAVLYAQNCASCHSAHAQGSFTWRKQGADGFFPPPPLDGTGHAWHHPLRALASQIKSGAPGGRGNMPSFAKTLSDEQIDDVIAWFQDRWPNDIYAAWFNTESKARRAGK